MIDDDEPGVVSVTFGVCDDCHQDTAVLLDHQGPVVCQNCARARQAMDQGPATMRGKAFALEQLAHRRANRPKQIDNGSLYAGAVRCTSTATRAAGSAISCQRIT